MAGIPSPPIGAVFDSDTLPGTKMYVFDLRCLSTTPITEINVIPITVSPYSTDKPMYRIRSHFDIPFIKNKSNNFISNVKVPANDVNKCIFEIENYSDDGQRIYRTILQLALHQINEKLTKPIRNNVLNETSNVLSRYAFNNYTLLKSSITDALNKKRITPVIYNKLVKLWHSPDKNIRASAVKASASFPPLPPRVTATPTLPTSLSSVSSAAVPAPPPSLTSLSSVPPTIAPAPPIVPPSVPSGKVERGWRNLPTAPPRPPILVTSNSSKPPRSIMWSNLVDSSIKSDPHIKSTLETAYKNKEKYTSVPAIVELYKFLNSEAKQWNVAQIIETSGKIQLEKEQAFADVQPIIKTAKEDQEKYGTGPLMAELYRKLDVAIDEKHIDRIKAIARDIVATKEELIYGGLLQAAMVDREKYNIKNTRLRTLYSNLDFYIRFGYKPDIVRTAQSIVNAKKTCNANESSCVIAGGTRRRRKHKNNKKHSRKSKSKATRRRI